MSTVPHPLALTEPHGRRRPARGSATVTHLLSHPVDFFQHLDKSTSTSSFRRLLLVSLPVLPLLSSFPLVFWFDHAFSQHEQIQVLADYSWFIAYGFSVALLLLQALGMGLHLVIWMLLARVLGAESRHAVVKAWCFAAVPLIVRQIFMAVATLGLGVEWFSQRSPILQAVDPFLIWSAVLFYWAGRHTLSLSRGRAISLALLSSFVGLLGTLLST